MQLKTGKLAALAKIKYFIVIQVTCKAVTAKFQTEGHQHILLWEGHDF